MPKYESLSDGVALRISREKQSGSFENMSCDSGAVVRRRSIPGETASVWCPPFVHDIDRILHCPYYNRYADKTQVFSLVRNDDVTRRSLHVQLVSRIARTIGSALNLNLDLIEAIALGHDMGHTPFAHSGEVYLNEIYHQHTGRYFCHNIHSCRVLDGIFPLNLSLQTLSGIAGHNGEIEMEEYYPQPLGGFAEFDALLERAYTEKGFANKIQPSTLEGALVRICDIIAYLGKDRQDAARVNVVPESAFYNEDIGSLNAEIINNLVVNIIENSYGKPYIKLDKRHFEALRISKRENYSLIYEGEPIRKKLDRTVKPMMGEIYGQMLDDLIHQRKNSPVFTHHIEYVNQTHHQRQTPYEVSEPNQLVVDYIASMTDDYLIDLHHYLFPDSQYKVEYLGYFDEMNGGDGHV